MMLFCLWVLVEEAVFCSSWSLRDNRQPVSPDLSEHRASSDGDEHRLQIWTPHHLNLPLLDDVHLSADLPLKYMLRKKAGPGAAAPERTSPRVLTFIQTKSPGRYTTDLSLVSMSNTICLSQP